MKKVLNILLIILGTFFVLLGVIGLILPVMPTTPFLILAGICYINSSKKLYAKLIKLQYFGPAIESYVERREVSKQFKTISLLFLYFPTAITQIFIVHKWYYRVFPIVMVLLITWHILSLKTVEKEKILKNANQEVNKEFD